ncbi:MAG: hypothetical protein HY368_00020 [Candidatus Aenigmarchaeota archaeon]|nr:hypothetical protein [Candidatus Aenigmarchaeota archaeon]
MNAWQKAMQNARPGTTLDMESVSVGTYPVSLENLEQKLQLLLQYLDQVGCKYRGARLALDAEITEDLKREYSVIIADDPMEVSARPIIERREEYEDESLQWVKYEEFRGIEFDISGLKSKRMRRIEGAIRRAFRE